MSKKVLVTGATGNVGQSVVKYLQGNKKVSPVLAVRNEERALDIFTDAIDLDFIEFDFEDCQSYSLAFEGADLVFLLRPPHISDVQRYFKPLIDEMVTQHVAGVVFLSVQGAETSRFIPHHKIEKLIVASGIPYVFVRPGYFMQNLTTTLSADVLVEQEIRLPAGEATFNWVDVDNIGEATAELIGNFEKYKSRAYEITGYENLSFGEATKIIRDNSQVQVAYQSINPIKFFFEKRKAGMKTPFILVMIMLHFLPRFQKAPQISIFFEQLTGKKPTKLSEFVQRESVFQ